ncbi:TIGR03619 family F420-dependent LLM class oxidoreductase [Actinomadura sp. CNU-125]|uniref:TIGR03619 family F420-dependent LLM class oxidoreductase n=1 Tax=Actinomadura sp. CNU-125 TaxID=1904961 RepID=UPI00130183A1|nr:TIGR03619 family F420-dependent LLM class oxidoreductase [Actinomadura sp. CNU-125]
MPIIELAREAEARGLRAISLPEHTHMPVVSAALVPGWPIARQYQRTLDPYIACAFIAATTSLEVGTAVSLPAQHDAIALAKAIATLDHLAQGRVILGFGFGYNKQEIIDHGIVPDRRFGVVEEAVALMRALWTDEIAEFDGRHHRLSRSWAWPKPLRPGGPPVLLGGRATERNLERIVTWADGWLPAGIGATAHDLPSSLAELRVRWRDAGRERPPEICCFFGPGSRGDMGRELERAAELGIQRLHLRLEDRPRDLVLPVLDDLAAVPRPEARGRAAAGPERSSPAAGAGRQPKRTASRSIHAS